MNPITRRPGPGRGRPKKQPQPPAPMPIPPLPGQVVQPGQVPQPGQPQPDQVTQADQPLPPPTALSDGLQSLPESIDLPLKDDSLDMSLKDDDDNEETEEHDAKRIKLDDPPQDQTLDDEAVLALAAHSNNSSVDAYASEYPTAGLTGSDPHPYSFPGET